MPSLQSVLMPGCWQALAWLAIGGLLWWLVDRFLDKFVRRLPPGPVPLPIIGNLLNLVGEPPHKALPALSSKYGPLMTLYFGSKRTVILGSGEMLKEAFVTNGSSTAGRPRMPSAGLVSNGYRNIAFSEGTLWRNLRKMAKLELLNHGKIPDALSIVYSEVSTVMGVLHRLCKGGGGETNVAPKKYLRSITMNTIFRLMIGKRLDVEDPNKTPDMLELDVIYSVLFQMLGSGAPEDIFPLLSLLPTPRMRRIRKLVARRNTLLTAIIDKKKSDLASCSPGCEAQDVMTSLLKSQPMSKLSEADCAMMVNDIVAAAIDTTASSMEWLLLFLATHQETQAAVHRELDSAFGASLPAGVQIDTDKLPMLRASIMEAMRMRMVAPLGVPHESRVAITLGGYGIPANTQLITNAMHVANDPKTWRDPERFRPERFLEEESHLRLQGGGSFPAVEDYKFAPFSVGHRYCPGSDMAKMELFLIAAHLLHGFHWAPTQGGKICLEGQFGLTLEAPDQALLCTPRHPRAPAAGT